MTIIHNVKIDPGQNFSFRLNHGVVREVNSVLIAEMSGEYLRNFNLQAQELWNERFSQLPANTIDDVNAYPWYVCKDASGETTAYSLAWVEDGSVVGKADRNMYRLEVYGENDMPIRLKEALANLGIYEYSIKVV